MWVMMKEAKQSTSSRSTILRLSPVLPSALLHRAPCLSSFLQFVSGLSTSVFVHSYLDAHLHAYLMPFLSTTLSVKGCLAGSRHEKND